MSRKAHCAVVALSWVLMDSIFFGGVDSETIAMIVGFIVAAIRVLEDVHLQLCEGAAPFIVGFENVSKGDKPATAEDAEWFLDLTFPEMGVKEDADGNPVLDKDGSPQFEMTNCPFAKQVGEFAGKQANRLGNAPKG
ncbi:hypothetical protein JQW38_18635 [Sulfitobacter pseudonitzschiae]|nr:hypothetical protein [Pseudosulfitobacter pseudonitzschiae]MBM1926309.1 hypothetical protein [Pseudosulfitobacter pseudonitzschiae]